MQGGAYAAATLVQLLLSRGGARQLIWGAGVCGGGGLRSCDACGGRSEGGLRAVQGGKRADR